MLQIQLQKLPDLIGTRNKKLSPGEVPISKVTNVRTLCDVLNQDVPMSGEMFSEVKRLLKIFTQYLLQQLQQREASQH